MLCGCWLKLRIKSYFGIIKLYMFCLFKIVNGEIIKMNELNFLLKLLIEWRNFLILNLVLFDLKCVKSFEGCID